MLSSPKIIGNNEKHDSELVLLAGSKNDKIPVMFLCDLLKIDAYSARLKLNTKLPNIITTCHKNDALGSLGNELTNRGINFLAIDDIFLYAPFEPFIVHSCDFSKGRLAFFNKAGESADIPLDSKVLMLESRYRDEQLERQVERQFLPFDLSAKQMERGSKMSHQKDTRQVIHIYVQNSSSPVCLEDGNIDYSSLGSTIETSASWNFRKLVNTIELFFDQKVDRSMVENSFALSRSLIEEKRDSQHTSTKHTRVFSNSESTNLMSRLLYSQWWKSSGWADRIMPPEGWL